MSLLILFDCRRPVAAGRVKGSGTQGTRENKCCYKELLLEKKPIDGESPAVEATAALQLILRLQDATKATAVTMQEGEDEEPGERNRQKERRKNQNV
jgi:hypothetical protein